MSAPRSDAYEIVTSRVLELLERGTVPWRRPWRDLAGAGRCGNVVSGRPYHGLNSLLLPSLGFPSPWFLTFNQARELGGGVRKGERGFPVTFWRWLDGRPDPAAPDAGPRRVPLLRYFTVFNLTQCDIPADRLPARARLGAAPAPAPDPIPACERIVDAFAPPRGPAVRHGFRACYFPRLDEIEMPRPESFLGAPERYATLFHEMAHATGHASRLGRFDSEGAGGARFGSGPYAREELVAEMAAAFLCQRAGIDSATIENAAAYVANWLGALKRDPRAVVVAAGAAVHAAEYISGERFRSPEPEGGDNAEA